jgi:hypothetical protein
MTGRWCRMRDIVIRRCCDGREQEIGGLRYGMANRNVSSDVAYAGFKHT